MRAVAVRLNEKTQKIAILALLCMLLAQLNAAFSPVGMNSGDSGVAGQVADSVEEVHSHGQHSHHSMQQDSDRDAEIVASDHHQVVDCDEQCINCVNHSSSIGIQKEGHDRFALDFCPSANFGKNSLSRIERPFRPPIIS
ncbi:MAG: hypothetical protein P8N94_05660 [Gammaproteobacteria bacterium]|nr:hypothetical protein [Gammaproteobacteria bacterium]